jgi:hypothetical protein
MDLRPALLTLLVGCPSSSGVGVSPADEHRTTPEAASASLTCRVLNRPSSSGPAEQREVPTLAPPAAPSFVKLGSALNSLATPALARKARFECVLTQEPACSPLRSRALDHASMPTPLASSTGVKATQEESKVRWSAPGG